MKRLMAILRGAAEALLLLTVAPVAVAVVAAAVMLSDLFGARRGGHGGEVDEPVSRDAVSVVIPTWNGRDHLARNLSSVVEALAGNPAHQIIVVDNASTDGTAEFLRERFPGVQVLACETNLGFGEGSNAGFRAARNDIVVLLNNDMRVDAGFLDPLLDGFRDPRVFAVTAQIFFSDPNKRREETGLVHGQWLNGRLHLNHIIDGEITGLFPTFYAGGGSTAYDRRKFLALGGFDEILKPFYVEDTDVSFQAWKRGWVILYAPGSIVYHEHRGTIGKHFEGAYIDLVVQKNHLLFAWKNIHEWSRLAAHFGWLYAGFWVNLIAGPRNGRAELPGFWKGARQVGGAIRARTRARAESVVSDTEALRRPLGGYFRDRFGEFGPAAGKLNVLFVSPYPMEPPRHGGAVFMNQTVRRLSEISRLHLLCLLDQESDLETNRALEGVVESADFMVRWKPAHGGIGSMRPFAARTFYDSSFLWRLHRNILLRGIDVVQFDYTQLATYAPDFRRIATFLFEHDVYFQSVARGMGAVSNPFVWTKHAYEYLRALRFERQALGRFDEIQACTEVNKRYLESFAWNGAPVYAGLRAGIDVSRYRYVESGRQAGTILFVGNFQHPPNQEALNFFVREAWPSIQQRHGAARLVVVGAQSTPGFRMGFERPGIEFLGEVDDIREALERCAVFVCPILSGSGVRVKLLEAFAAGIPVVSTPLGAEGLLRDGVRLVELASDGAEFAERVCDLLDRPEYAAELARGARREVEQLWDMAAITRKLESRYRAVCRQKLARAERIAGGPPLDLGPRLDLPLALADARAGVRSRVSDAS